jgi:nitrate/TMAO reductase-like tetraheme cytochrome c subunit
MRISFWLLIVLLIVGAVFGAGAIIGSTVVNRYTSTDAFCTSCHTMAFQADDPYFQRSAHRSANKGVRPTCGDCHIPKTNWFVETYTHVSSGLRDAYAESTKNFSSPMLWEARRIELAQEIQADMHSQDSVTCRSCHDANAIHPLSEDGQKAHALLRQGGVTCVDCHTNLVHPAAASAGTQSSAQQRGSVLFAANCAICHGAQGNGRGQRQANMNPPPANLTLPPWSEAATAGRTFLAIRNGVPGTAMSSWPMFSDEKIWDLVAYITSLKG